MGNTQLSEEDIRFVDELVRNAGRLALDMRDGVAVHTKTGPSDLVTDADLLLSRKIKEALSKRFSDDLIISEEDQHGMGEPQELPRRIWLIDPIDGTENYVKQDGQYSSMIGLLVDGKPYYGWIYQPTTRTLFYGGGEFGAWYHTDDEQPVQFRPLEPLHAEDKVRIMIGWGDRKRHPWIANLANVEIVQSQSMGLKIIKILRREADLFINLTGRVKLWDTAAPGAIALGASLDVGTAEGRPLPYPVPQIQHGSSIIIGRPGAVSWALKFVDGHATRSVPK